MIRQNWLLVALSIWLILIAIAVVLLILKP
jgi:hypothetical protein